ncbi:MAG TPA: hypothetical protein VF756_00855 [Thermoanaerobaculia bacterium]
MRLRHIIASALIPLAVGLLGMVIADLNVFKIDETALPWIYALAVGCIGVSILIYLHELLQNLRAATKELEEKEQLIAHTKALPSFVFMKNRCDRFIFDREGTATLLWSFEIDGSLSKAETTEILFPIFAEIGPEAQSFKTAIKVEALTVDGKRMNPKQTYIPLEAREKIGASADDMGQRMEFGALKVPVVFSRGGTLCKVELKLKLENSFPNLSKREFVYVDVPIVTEQIKVILESATEGRIAFLPWQKDDTLIATSGMVENRDPGETHRQRNRWRQTEEKTLVWQTDYPKLGYRYKLSFYLDEDQDA